MKKDKLWEGLKNYFSWEIAIEYKACLYFFAILFFYCMFRITRESFSASMLHMAEMILTTYLMGYFQVYLLGNFDEAEKLGKKELLYLALCTILYTVSSWAFGWFERDWIATAIFAAFIAFAYWCVYFINKIKRAIDTENLNRQLTEYKGQKPDSGSRVWNEEDRVRQIGEGPEPVLDEEGTEAESLRGKS